MHSTFTDMNAPHCQPPRRAVTLDGKTIPHALHRAARHSTTAVFALSAGTLVLLRLRRHRDHHRTRGQVPGRGRRELRERHSSSSTTATAPPPSSGPSADGTVRALGKCLDVTGNSTADGAKLQLWDCTGGANQKWTVSTARDLVDPQANKCADVTGNTSANGTPIQIWTCTGAANQKWTAPAADGRGTPPSAPMAVAYLYNGWGNPPSPTTVMNATA